MRVELLQHTTDAVLHKFLLVHGIDIEITDRNLCYLQLAKRGVFAKIKL